MYLLVSLVFWGKMAQSISVSAVGFISMARIETQQSWPGGYGWYSGYGGYGGYGGHVGHGGHGQTATNFIQQEVMGQGRWLPQSFREILRKLIHSLGAIVLSLVLCSNFSLSNEINVCRGGTIAQNTSPSKQINCTKCQTLRAIY